MNPGLLAIKKRSVVTSGYASVVLGDGPVAYWPCQEPVGSTSVSDATGNGYNMSVNTSSSVSLGSNPLRKGATGSLTTTTRTWGAAISSNLPLSTSEFTLECWVKANSTGCFYYTFFSPPGGGSSVGYPSLYGCNTVVACRTSYNNDVGYNTNLTSPTHVAITFSNNTASLYVNGALVTTRSLYANYSGGGGYQLMGDKNYPGSYSLVGSGSDFAIYNKALTAAQILSHYNAGK